MMWTTMPQAFPSLSTLTPVREWRALAMGIRLRRPSPIHDFPMRRPW